MIKQSHKKPIIINTIAFHHTLSATTTKGRRIVVVGINCIKMSSRQREQVGDFYIHLVNNDVAADQEGAGSRRRGRQPQLVVDKNLTSSTKLLAYNEKLPGSNGIKKPTVIHFYDGG
jgi:hypothetical protein